jgi:hypothetical protein
MLPFSFLLLLPPPLFSNFFFVSPSNGIVSYLKRKGGIIEFKVFFPVVRYSTMRSDGLGAVGGSCLALAELGRCGPLPLPDAGEVDTTANKLGLLTRLLAILKSDKINMRVRNVAPVYSNSQHNY